MNGVSAASSLEFRPSPRNSFLHGGELRSGDFGVHPTPLQEIQTYALAKRMLGMIPRHGFGGHETWCAAAGDSWRGWDLR